MSSPRSRGRPRTFDIDQALDAAMEVFWQKGYEGTSLSDLTQAMGINRPSLYATFGNKEALFRKVLDRYVERPAAYVRAALAEPTARAAVERLLSGAVESLTDPCHPKGCLLVQGGLSCGEAADPIRGELAQRRMAGEAAIRRRLERARSDGDLPPGADPAVLARYVATVLQGIAVQVAGGATREELQPVVRMALQTWPE